MVDKIKIDTTDNKIISALKENSKLSYRKLAKKLLLPVTKVHHRIRNLENRGVIKKYTVVLDNKKLGKDLCAYILIKVDYSYLKSSGLSQQELAKKFKRRDDIEDVCLVTGLKDIILKVRVSSIDELNQFITKDLRNNTGVKSTETLIILDELN